MATVTEAELEQKISEFIMYIRDYAGNKNQDFVLDGKRDGFKFSMFDRDATLEFSV